MLDNLIKDAEHLLTHTRQLRVAVAEYGRLQNWPDNLAQAHYELFDALSGLSDVLEYLNSARSE